MRERVLGAKGGGGQRGEGSPPAPGRGDASGSPYWVQKSGAEAASGPSSDGQVGFQKKGGPLLML